MDNYSQWSGQQNTQDSFDGDTTDQTTSHMMYGQTQWSAQQNAQNNYGNIDPKLIAMGSWPTSEDSKNSDEVAPPAVLSHEIDRDVDINMVCSLSKLDFVRGLTVSRGLTTRQRLPRYHQPSQRLQRKITGNGRQSAGRSVGSNHDVHANSNPCPQPPRRLHGHTQVDKTPVHTMSPGLCIPTTLTAC